MKEKNKVCTRYKTSISFGIMQMIGKYKYIYAVHIKSGSQMQLHIHTSPGGFRREPLISGGSLALLVLPVLGLL